jgi:DNA ligase D-like protein (predicted 3'-phosphoesterase)
MSSIIPVNLTHPLRFVVHEHHALKAGFHYDLRLEHEGVLKSFVCHNKEHQIPIEITDKQRLLIPTFDHDLSYLNFEGIIGDDNDEDEYGKGSASIWDKGTFDLIKWTDKKEIIVNFHGHKLQGFFSFHWFIGKSKKPGYLFQKMKNQNYVSYPDKIKEVLKSKFISVRNDESDSIFPLFRIFDFHGKKQNKNLRIGVFNKKDGEGKYYNWMLFINILLPLIISLIAHYSVGFALFTNWNVLLIIYGTVFILYSVIAGFEDNLDLILIAFLTVLYCFFNLLFHFVF